MFYIVYLFSSLIFICSNLAEADQHVQSFQWLCANQNCDKPISEFETKSRLLVADHRDKLTYEIKSKGRLLKKPSDDSEFFFVEMDGKQGYVNKNNVREIKIFEKGSLVQVEGENPLANKQQTEEISPSQPTVIDGTTLYGVNERHVTNSVQPAPSLAQSASPDSVDNKVQHEVHIDPNASLFSSQQAGADNSLPSDYDEDVDIEIEDDDEVQEKHEEENQSSSDIALNQTDEQQPQPSSTVSHAEPSPDNHQSSTAQYDETLPANVSSVQHPVNESIPNKQHDETLSANVSLPVPNNSRYFINNRSPSAASHLENNAQFSFGETDGNLTDNTPSAIEEGNSTLLNEMDSSKTSDSPSIPPPTSLPAQVSEELNSSLSPPTQTHPPEHNLSPSHQHPHPSPPQPYPQDTPLQPTSFPHHQDTPQHLPSPQDPPQHPPSPPYPQDTPQHPPSSPYSQDTPQQPPSSPYPQQSYKYPPISPYPQDTLQPQSSFPHAPADDQSNSSQDTAEKISSLDETSNQANITENKTKEPTETEDQVKKLKAEDEAKEPSEIEDGVKEPTEEEDKAEEPSEIDDGVKEPSEEEDETNKPSETDDETDEDEARKEVTIGEDEARKEGILGRVVNEDVLEKSFEEESTGFYSSVRSMLASLSLMFDKSPLPPPAHLPESTLAHTPESPSSDSSTAPGGYCFEGELCRGLESPLGGEDQPSFFAQSNAYLYKNSTPLSLNSIIYIGISSLVILLFSLGYYYIDKSQSCGGLVAKVNELSQELFVTKKERDTLEEQLLKIKQNCNMMDSSKMKQDSKLSSLQTALEQSERAKAELEESLVIMEKENEMLMEKGLEMHKLLSETISEEERSQLLLANIDELKLSLSEKLDEIVALTNQLDQKNQEMQLMQIDVGNSHERVKDLEKKLESSKAESEDLFSKKLNDQQQQIIKLQKLVEEKGMVVAKLESELAKTKVERDSAEGRASSAEAGLQAAHSVGAGEARQAWLDATSVRAALALAQTQNQTLQHNITDLTANNRALQDKLEKLSEELVKLNLKYEEVEREKVGALTKLQVLSDYFKEKETKLQEELGVKESQWLQKQSEDHTIYEQMKSLRDEISSYKAQNDKLKAEILEQEASYKVQIANEEHKSYDNWVALRQAERKIKELQMESAHLRNRLTHLETTNTHIEPLNPNGLEKVVGASPTMMMMPPLPQSEFFALPPPPLHPSASRPPPLGRISSPQLSGEMIPPPPLVGFEMYPPPPSSTPPPPFPMYAPQPRDRPLPPPKDSPPSNYSSESVNDKGGRRRRR